MWIISKHSFLKCSSQKEMFWFTETFILLSLSFLPALGFHSSFYLLAVWRVGGFGGFLFKPMSVSAFSTEIIESERAEVDKYSCLRSLPSHQQLKTPCSPKVLSSTWWRLQKRWRRVMGKRAQPTENPAERELSLQTTSCMKGQWKKFSIKGAAKPRTQQHLDRNLPSVWIDVCPLIVNTG